MFIYNCSIYVVPLLSHVQFFATPWVAAHQASLSFTFSRSLLRFMSIESVILSNHSCCPPPPALNLSQHQGLFQWVDSASGDQIIEALASVLPMNIQNWFPSELTGLISSLSKGLSGVSSTTTVQRHQLFGTLPFLRSNSGIHTCLLKKA